MESVLEPLKPSAKSSSPSRKAKRARFSNDVIAKDASTNNNDATPSSSLDLSIPPHPYGVLPEGNRCYNNNNNKTHQPTASTMALQTVALQDDDECWTNILSFCTPNDLCRVAATSRYLYVLAHQPELWRDVCLGGEGKTMASIHTFCGNWKDTWRYHHQHQQQDNNNATMPALQRHQPLILPGIYSDHLHRQHACRNFPIPQAWYEETTTSKGGVAVLHNASLTCPRFRTEYEAKNIPVLLKGAAKSWPAYTKWQNNDYLAQHFGTKRTLRATSGTAQHAAQFTWSAYQEYCDSNSATKEEGPLYLFDRTAVLGSDGGGGNDASSSGSLAADCCESSTTTSIPTSQNRHDLFAWLGPDRRPDHTWLIAGGQRSGSVFHIDPNATHAWNACIVGHKRWILCPPSSQGPMGVRPSADGDQVLLPISLGEWMWQYYYHRDDDSPQRLLEITAAPGDILFVPHGWWHMVVNMDPWNVAVTHNYVAPSNLANVLRFLRDKTEQVSGCRDRPGVAIPPEKLYDAFVHVLRNNEPELLEAALAVEDWTCAAWSSSTTHTATVMEKAKEGGGGDGSFSFSFL